MLRSYLAAALRNLRRSPLYSSILIVGLALGLAPAILIGLYVRDDFSYDRWIPGYQDIYRTVLDLNLPGFPLNGPSAGTAPPVAGWLAAEFPQILAIGRMKADMRALKHGLISTQERVYWADAAIFDVLRLPTVAGDLKTALARPDSLVITRRAARKYFGDAAPLGQTLDIDGQPFRISAVLKDLPPQTHLDTEIFASGRAPLSPLPDVAAPLHFFNVGFGSLASTYTYLRLKPGTDIRTIERGLPALIDHHVRIPHGPDGKPFVPAPRIEMQPLTRIHFIPGDINAMKPAGSLLLDYSMLAIGGLLVLVSACNFVNLMTARATRRAMEVGVRKAVGAGRTELIVQFVGESVLVVLVSTVLALALVELLAPFLSPLLPHPLAVDWSKAPQLVAAIVGLTALLGVLVGLYPALVLARFRPATVLKGGVIQPQGRARVRTALVTLQFSILIGLIVVTATVYQQVRYATTESLRFDTDQILYILTDCRNAFPDAVRRLPGVRSAACTNDLFGLPDGTFAIGSRPDSSFVLTMTVNVDFSLLELFGLHPLAGRFFSPDHPGDAAQPAQQPGKPLGTGGTVVINETAARKLGFASAQAAVGHAAVVPGLDSAPMIIGVAPDVRIEGARQVVPPVLFRLQHPYTYLVVKLRGDRIPETLTAIDRLFRQLGTGHPIDRSFLRADIETFYRDVERQTELLAVVATVAVVIAVLGLFGLAAFMAERRTKEIGIRKALGAHATDILQLLLWELTRPVLWANLIAWPIAAYLMNRWLSTFAYHKDLDPFIFAGAGCMALAIAAATVAGHAIRVARLHPVSSLRYE